MKSTRRTVVAAMTTMLLAGCSLPREEALDLDVINNTEATRRVEIAFEDDGDTVFAETYSLKPDSLVVENEILTGYEYTVTVSLDTGGSMQHRYIADTNCSDRGITVTILDETTIDFAQEHCS
jgi:hypothetical protein